mgnify:CR=1 FL=1
MLETLQAPPPDKILALSGMFRADPRAGKLDLGVGVYRDESGATPVMRAVRAAEARLHAAQTTKTYLGPAGDEAFCRQVAALALGDAAPAERLAMAQTPGGTGAVRLLADLASRAERGATLWISDPSWPNHAAIAKAAGLAFRTYPYYDPASGGVAWEAMRAALASAGPGDVVLLHGCCHNPTGADLDVGQWRELAGMAASLGFTPFVDLAYQGFGDGLEADVAGLRAMAATVPEMLLAISCSKNFGVYRDRVGCAVALAAGPEAAAVTQETLKAVARVLWSMPPDHGAAVVRTVLEDAGLRADWLAELDAVRARMLTLRAGLSEALRARLNTDAFDAVARQRGMFSLLPVGPAQVERLRVEHGVYLVGDGRANIAGLSAAQIDALAEAIAAVGA